MVRGDPPTMTLVPGARLGPYEILFALGAVLYELATGRRAFARETAAETGTEGEVWLAELE